VSEEEEEEGRRVRRRRVREGERRASKKGRGNGEGERRRRERRREMEGGRREGSDLNGDVNEDTTQENNCVVCFQILQHKSVLCLHPSSCDDCTLKILGVLKLVIVDSDLLN
jgi:hypothetical protein